MSVVFGHEIGKRLVAAGLVPPLTRRIVIDLAIDEVATVYYATIGQEAMLDEVIKSLVAGEPVVKDAGLIDVTTMADTFQRMELRPNERSDGSPEGDSNSQLLQPLSSCKLQDSAHEVNP